jgi:Leu/Phe-tRNA-protein transferase
MDTITITFDGDSVVVTDGRHTSESHFSEITDADKRAFVALADFFGYEPAYLLNFEDDENFEEDF